MNTHMQKHVKALGMVYLEDSEHVLINADVRFDWEAGSCDCIITITQDLTPYLCCVHVCLY